MCDAVLLTRVNFPMHIVAKNEWARSSKAHQTGNVLRVHSMFVQQLFDPLKDHAVIKLSFEPPLVKLHHFNLVHNFLSFSDKFSKLGKNT